MSGQSISKGLRPLISRRTNYYNRRQVSGKKVLESILTSVPAEKNQVCVQSTAQSLNQEVGKSYNYKRSKIDFTMKDLENDLDEEDDFEVNAAPTTSSLRSNPKRSSANKKIIIDTSDDVENSIDEENQLNITSESNSDWYDYPESNSDDDSIPPLLLNVTYD